MGNNEILDRLLAAGSIFLNHTAVNSFIRFAQSSGVEVVCGRMIGGGQWLYISNNNNK